MNAKQSQVTSSYWLTPHRYVTLDKTFSPLPRSNIKKFAETNLTEYILSKMLI